MQNRWEEYRDLHDRGAGIIRPFSDEAVTAIAYDLETEAFAVAAGKESRSVTLAPGESAFVKSKEEIMLPADILCRVILRNSRIRQGLSLDAPVYYPGHHTKVFFRITNVSKHLIHVDTANGLASVMFELLESPVDDPYSGAFQREFDFTGMGAYSSVLAEDMVDIEKKVENVKEIERTIYGNVLAIMAVFVGIFSIININLQNASLAMMDLISLNLTISGALCFLVAVITTVTNGSQNGKLLWCASAIAFAAAIVIQSI